MRALTLSTILLLASFINTLPTEADHQSIINDAQYTTSNTIRDILVENEIIDQVLDDFEPTYTIDIVYAKHHESVTLGNDIPVKSVKNRPAFVFHAIQQSETAPKNESFTLILTDPDAKSRAHPIWSEMCHWIVTNLSATVTTASFEIEKSLPGELASYNPPGPPPKTGAHRYVFVLLQGESKNIAAPKDRKHWGYKEQRHGVRDWAKDNNLTVVGANFFFAKNKKQ